MIQLTRKEAEDKINHHWASAKAECIKVGMPFADYDIDRIRNYEIEHTLNTLFGEEHVISEWCPYNGIYSSWIDHCPINELQRLCGDMADQQGTKYHIQYLEKRISERNNTAKR